MKIIKLEKILFFFLLSTIYSLLFTPSFSQEKSPPKEPEKPDTPAKPAPPKGPGYTIERFESGMFSEAVRKKQEEISKIRINQIRKYKDLLSNPYYENKAEVYHRLAETCWDENHYQYLVRRADYDKAYESFEAGTLKEKPSEPREDYKECLDYYKKVLQEFPGYGRIDEVIYYLGKGALQEGKAKKNKNVEKEGIDYLTRLVQNHPNSKYIAQTHLALAEYFFENNSLYYAKTNYEKIVTNYKTSPMFNYALYKVAWVYFNLSEFDKAIDTFKKVVAIVGKENEKGKIEFKNQAIKDLIQTYAEVENGWEKARDYFLTIMDEKETYKKLRALADLYISQDKDAEAIELIRHFIGREKSTENIPGYYREILEIHKKTNDILNLDKVTYEILEYFKDKGTWMIANKSNEDAVTEAKKLGETYLLFITNHYHREAERLKNAEFYKMAAERYNLFLERFPESKSCYIVNFYYAEILYHQIQDFKKAAEQYESVIERDTKGEYVEDAALGVIYSYEELMVKAGIQERAKKKTGIETMKVDPKVLDAPIPETPLHQLEQGYIKAADKYVELMMDLIKDPSIRKKNPERGAKIPEIMFIASQVLYRHGKMAEAVERLKVLFTYDPQSEFASYAVFTLLDCYKRLQRWEKVEEWARKLIEAKNFKVRSKKDLEKIVSIAIVENAKQLSIEKKYDETIKNFMRAYEEFKSEKDFAGNALFNVAAAYENSKDIEKAVATYKRVVKEFPTLEIAPRAQFAIAEIYEAQTQFAKAADSFEQMEKFEKDIDMYKKQMDEAKNDPEKQKNLKEILEMIPDSIINAGLIREALGDYNGAIKSYQKFIKLYPKHQEIPNVDFRIGLIYEAMDTTKSLKQAADHFVSYAKKYSSLTTNVVEAYSRAGADLKKIDKLKNRKTASNYFTLALKEFAKLVSKPEEMDKCKWFAAQGAFQLADYMYDDFNNLKIPSTLEVRILKKALIDKGNAHKSAEKGFDDVLTYKSGYWTAGALFKIGLLYYEFAKELFNVPIPEGLPPDVEQAYIDTLEEIARPIEEKSLGAFDKALSLAHEQKVYNEWSKKCGEMATKVNPDSYPILGEEYVSPDKYKDTLLSTSFIRSLKRGNVEVRYIK